MRKRILYLTQWFDPEPGVIKGPAFVRALEAGGYDVTVVTGFPNYPGGRLYPGYRLRPIMRETIDGARVTRLPLYPSHDGSSLKRALNFLSFFLSTLFYCLARSGRYDLVYVYHPPITVGLAAVLAGMVRRRPLILEIQDLWPDTVSASGMAGTGRLAGILGRICAFVYRRATRIIVQSEGMRRTLIERDVPPARLATVRNWADAEALAEPATIDPADYGFGKRFSIVYGGNLGRAQALETVVDAAAIAGAHNADIDMVFFGDGIDADRLRAHAWAVGATCVRFEARVPKAIITGIFDHADALLIHLADHPLFAITIPSKTQFYLAMGRPILAAVRGEAAELLSESRAALVVPPGDAAALAEAMIALAAMPAAERAAMAASGRAYYQATLSFDKGIASTLEVVADALRR
ncbi:MAG: glycosyl transferase group 1 [Sphingomonas bacterium]|uniref:glycosyltransferase family 4 protein n=1 Tax=Sphingomonas bacterium TaxID=1895847 RepID=UPI0026107C35|nr:glycosyltransferase family 4 protein [Sphingomonas bacterium]MDB5703906.1 glycosyl transferase group 1 [Sphingomonas bacterium]